MADSFIEVETLVVGGGISGLKAISDLIKHGCTSCLLVEARDRLGGRLHTVTGYQGRKYDLGASWHHDTLVNGLFLEELSLEKEEQAGYVFDDFLPLMFDKTRGRVDSDPELTLEILNEELMRFLELQFLEDVDAKDCSYFEMVVRYLFERRDLLSDEQIQYLPQASRFLELWHGIDWKTQSSKFLEIVHQGRNALVLHYDKIVKRIARTIPQDNFRLNTSVNQISRQGRNVLVKTADGLLYKCDYVIVTVPQSILELSLHDKDEAARIKFDPPLDSKIVRALNKTHYGSLGKVIFEFETCCWSKKFPKIVSLGQSNSSFANSVRQARDLNSLIHTLGHDTKYNYKNGQAWDFPLFFVNLAKTTGVPSFVMLMQEPLTAYIESLDDPVKVFEFFEPILKRLLEELSCTKAIELDLEGVRPEKADDSPVLKNIIWTRWTREVYSRGAYSACFPGDDPLDLVIALTSDEHARVRFAGEHTIMDGAGCVYGAWESGKREAAIINKAFGRV
ncbi:LAMI_0C10660g1_1 [Lachancea mirantina]|uniref:LAMI_0C10660g1_1 n=1 Tax=Lachancea mirantina TaxID=1230905 RepID=A0A1G4J6C5_9SACH|nr:LAMI_0C10660g1_1 [Lachancea mirantina]